MVDPRHWRPPNRLRGIVRVATPEDGSLAEQVIGFLPFRGRRIAYAVSGAGPPLLLDVGRAHHLEVFWSYPPYRRLVQRLSRRFTVVRWDRPGCGLSDRGRPDLSPEADAALVERIVTFLGALQVSAVAAGDAGPTMVRFAADHPGRVSRLALFGTAAASPTLVPAADATLALLSGSSARAIHDVVATAQASGCEPEVGAWLTAAFEASADVSAMVELVRASASPDTLVDAARVRAPTLVLHRAGDPVVDARAARLLATRIPGAELRELDGGCHLPYAGDTEAVLAALLPFLSAGGLAAAELSGRELEVARMVALGLPNAGIATGLGIRRRTVEAHLEHIRTKLGVNTRAQIAVWFTRTYGLD